jgi:hypothetical protein
MLASMVSPLSGRCSCGRVRVELAPPTLFASYCHCETCRRVHGAPFVAWTAVARDGFRVVSGRDAITEYASSPGVVRAFCRHCGSPIFYKGEMAPDRIYVPVAILDALDRPLDSHVSYEERAPWLAGVHLLPCFHAKSDTPLSWR